MYQKFAQVYDLLMADVDYEGWATYIQELFSYYGSKPKTIIDLACGTGISLYPCPKGLSNDWWIFPRICSRRIRRLLSLAFRSNGMSGYKGADRFHGRMASSPATD